MEDDTPRRAGVGLHRLLLAVLEELMLAVPRRRGDECEKQVVWEDAGLQTLAECGLDEIAVRLVVAVGEVDVCEGLEDRHGGNNGEPAGR